MYNMSRKNTIAMMVEKLQRRLFVKHIDGVPQDVRQGHLAVIAVDGYDERRFVVPVSYLKHDSFVRLMEQAAEVYGFDHERAVVIPCRPSELERIHDGVHKCLVHERSPTPTHPNHTSGGQYDHVNTTAIHSPTGIGPPTSRPAILSGRIDPLNLLLPPGLSYNWEWTREIWSPFEL
nr:auxin-responsive protein SAUR72-like [Tanacetum cinerariifolium]